MSNLENFDPTVERVFEETPWDDSSPIVQVLHKLHNTNNYLIRWGGYSEVHTDKNGVVHYISHPETMDADDLRDMIYLSENGWELEITDFEWLDEFAITVHLCQSK